MTSEKHEKRAHKAAQDGRTSVLPNVLKISFGIAAAVVFFITALLSSTELIAYGIPGYFPHEFKKYNVYDDLPMKKADVDRVMTETMDFLRGDRESLQDVTAEIDGVGEAAFYGADEISHMEDVKVMFVNGLKLRNAAAVILAVLAGMLLCVARKSSPGRRDCARILRIFAIAQLTMIVICIVIAIYASTDFTRFFTMFHKIFFPQGNWEFDPAKSAMINMLPEGLFADTAMYVGIVFAISEIFAIAGAGYASQRMIQRR